jgi:hypothetical protein
MQLTHDNTLVDYDAGCIVPFMAFSLPHGRQSDQDYQSGNPIDARNGQRIVWDDGKDRGAPFNKIGEYLRRGLEVNFALRNSISRKVYLILELAKTATITYAPSEISIYGKRFILHEPLVCQVEVEEDGYFIYHDGLGITSGGETMESAKKDFNEWFGHTYMRFNELGDDQLSPRFQAARKLINQLVKEVV